LLEESGFFKPCTKSNEDEIVQIGTGLFDRFLLPFEAVSLLLLVALIGAIWIARARLQTGGGNMPSQHKPLL
jgi:NADH:ubiquinone oxidoreductase subunit 6 (subunit J)